MPVVLAHISDTHFDGGARNAERAVRVMTYLNALPLDAVVITGDVADRGTPEEYAQARVTLASPHRVLACPGNHDRRSAFRTHLLGGDAEETPINRAHRVGAVTVALCDSTIPGRGEGLLAPETLEWLAATLAGAPGPVVVCLHHPPVVLHNTVVDGLRLGAPRQLADVLARHRNVVALLCGHAHGAAASTFAGVPVLVAPGVVSTLLLPWERRGHLDHGAPPGLAFHVIDDEGRLTTHYRVLAA